MRPLLNLLAGTAGLSAVLIAYTAQPPSYENSLVLTPLYVNFAKEPADKIAQESAELKQRLGTAPYVRAGFAAFLDSFYPGADLNRPLEAGSLAPGLSQVDTIVERARANGLVTHISIVSGFFHGWNALRERAIQQDVRNAQWFADGLIAPPTDLRNTRRVPRSAWVTPSRYAQSLRARIEEGARIVGARLAAQMVLHPETLMSVSGDGEVEFSYERNFSSEGERESPGSEILLADYSPFTIAEFRDWIREKGYAGDLSPSTDDNRDGHTFNRDYGQSFSSWRLQYYDDSGPLPFSTYIRLSEKLPRSGANFLEGGFDAPRSAQARNRFWQAWLEFRGQVIANYVRDFARWITTSPDPVSGFTIPGSRYYSHQIPGEFLFDERDNLRLRTSASSIQSARIAPYGSAGVTAFNAFDGRRHSKTATARLFSEIYRLSNNWGILEYGPSIPNDDGIPPHDDEQYYLRELRQLYSFRPHVIVPFAWTDLPELRRYSIKGTAFERALRRFVQEVGKEPWAPRR